MSKYFADSKKVLLSEYIEEDIPYDTKQAAIFLKYLLGDLKLPTEIIDGYCEFFSHVWTRYDVAREFETVKGLYDFYTKFPRLSSLGFETIAVLYIKDLFEDYSLDIVFKKIIKAFDETDEAMELFKHYVESKADELDKKFEEEALKLDEYSSSYYMEGVADYYQYIEYLKSRVLREHVSVDSIIDSLADPELIKSDAKQLSELSRKYRCSFGIGYPISYSMTVSLARKEGVSMYGEIPTYYISMSDKSIAATFTTQEFIDSVEKVKKLTKKK